MTCLCFHGERLSLSSRRRKLILITPIQTKNRMRVESSNRILEPSAQKPTPVKETTLYPAQFSVLLRERLQGRSVAEVAEFVRPHSFHFVCIRSCVTL